MLQQCTIKAPNGALGLNLSRAPWDPYPWVSGVQAESNAQLAGVCIGDTLLQLNGTDVLGMRISDLATQLRDHWLTGADHVKMIMWRQQPASLASTEDPTEAAHAVQHGINQQSLQKFATCLQHIAQLLECPVCCDVIKPPGWQCCNGHVLCNNCRNRSEKCPVCRVPLGPRGRCLLSDKLFTLLAENFPCDGVKASRDANALQSNKKLSSANKCTNEYHNQPKMALAKSNLGKKSRKTSRQLQQQQEEAVILVVNGAAAAGQAEAEAEAECVKQVSGMPKGNEQSAQILRVRNNVNDAGLQRVATIKAQQEQQQGQAAAAAEAAAVAKELLQESNNMLVKPKLKLSKKSWQITGRDQDELHSDEVANINNGQQSLLGLGSESGLHSESVGQVLMPSKGQQQYQNYHCPTGKSCSNQAKLFQPENASNASNGSDANAHAHANAHKLSTTAESEKRLDAVAEIAFVVATNSVATLSASCHKGKPVASPSDRPSIKTLLHSQPDMPEWQLLQHLSVEHRLAVVHFYGTFGQRLHVHVQVSRAQACLRLSEPPTSNVGHKSPEVQTFFLALLPINDAATESQDKHAVFLWHLAAEEEQQHHFQTVIETQCRRIKWFGPAQRLTRSWPEIRAAGEFLTWTLDETANACAGFDIIIKRK